MHAYNVTYTRVNDAEALRGGTTRYGYVVKDLPLREAIRAMEQEAGSRAESRGCYPNDSRPENARWISWESFDWVAGDTLTLDLHFPESATPSSRARLTRTLKRAFG